MGWAQSNQVSKQAKRFVHEAARAGIAGVKLGKMATEQAESRDVQQFGQRMVKDHEKAVELFSKEAQQGQGAEQMSKPC
jgi:predicted outer membrane protein